VNYRGIMAKKGTPPEVIEKLAKIVPEMFKNGRVAKQMAAGGSPMKIMTREEVQKMWTDRQAYLEDLLKDLKKK
jgi:tripartite-type tricarboxylate transporter receptor subunit TctC